MENEKLRASMRRGEISHFRFLLECHPEKLSEFYRFRSGTRVSPFLKRNGRGVYQITVSILISGLGFSPPLKGTHVKYTVFNGREETPLSESFLFKGGTPSYEVPLFIVGLFDAKDGLDLWVSRKTYGLGYLHERISLRVDQLEKDFSLQVDTREKAVQLP